jgi:hypothetical protein
MASRFRHEDVASVPGGWKVRTVHAGSHRVRVAFPPGRKQVGSGRLVSILHPIAGANPCLNPCTLRSTNPAELMVMSANNPPRARRNSTAYRVIAIPRHGGEPLKHDAMSQREAREFAAEVDKKTYFHPHVQKIRVNPGRTPVHVVLAVRKDGTFADMLKKEFTDYKEAKSFAATLWHADKGKTWLKPKIITEFRDNPAELMVMGANPRVEVVSSPNPPTEEIVEEFTGREVEYLDVYNEPHMPRGRYGKLGPLIALYIKPAKGGQVQRIGASEAIGHDFPQAWGGKPPLVVTDSSAKQIYFVDGCQDLTPCLEMFGFGAGSMDGMLTLGQARRIDYQCRKEHIASPDEDLWKHEHGEENGVLPTVLFDTRNKRLLYEGGDYRIEGPWIRN